MTCTRHASLGAFRALGSADDGALPFALPGAPRRFSRDRHVDLRHVLLEVKVDFEKRALAGTVTHFLTPLRPGISRITLDAVEMDVGSVTLGGKRAAFRHDGEKLVVDTAGPLREGKEVRLSVSYSCTPRRGFYFIAPDDDHPARVAHGWSQGQDEDSRYWWPVHDSPNEKATTELVATVPQGMAAISNGKLVEIKKRSGGQESWHWKLDFPHSPYLVTLCVGPFEKLEQSGVVPMTTWFLPGRRAEAQRVVRDTPRMIKLFSQLTGVPYPYEKYDQVFVQEFIFGGMENTTATTITDLVLHDKRASLDYSAEDLVAHELAHQWWGNLVTCRDWSQAWLNEGFATYFEVVWKEHAHGPEEAWALQDEHQDQYLHEEDASYRRPIACRSYHDPIELFDAHLYQKGAWVVGMLREEIGDELFWRALKTYLTDNRAGSVVTDDLRRAVEKVTGRNLERFFEQWIEKAGHPELEIDTSWDEDRKELCLAIEQKQSGEGVPEAFHVTLPVRLLVPGKEGADGAWVEGTAALRQRRQVFVFTLDAEPTAVVLDPWDRVLKSVKRKRTVAELSATIASAPWAPTRAEAARGLGKDGSAKAIDALRKALMEDSFWRVRSNAAEALGDARSDAAFEVLAAAVGIDQAKVRRAVVAALGRFRTPKAFTLLRDLASRGDASYFVEAETLVSIGKTQQLDALNVLREAALRPESSWNEVVRCGALDGLGRLAFEQREAAIDTLIPWTEAQRFVRCRQAAIRSLAKQGEGSARVRECLERLLEDEEFRVVVLAAQALAEIGTSRSRGPLAQLAETSLEGRTRRAAREAMRRIGRREEAPVTRLRADLEASQADVKDLRERLEKVETRMKGATEAG
jgi:aminopeptidase N